MVLELKQYKNDYFNNSTEPYLLSGVKEITGDTEYGAGHFEITIFDRNVFYMPDFEYVKDAECGKYYVNKGKWVADND